MFRPEDLTRLALISALALAALLPIQPLTTVAAAAAPVYPFCACDFTTLGNFVGAGTVVFDTDALTFGGAPGGIDAAGVAVFAFDSITIPAGTAVVGQGSRPLALLSLTTAQIDGSVSVNGQSSVDGAGGPFAGGPGGGAGGPGPGSNPGVGPGAGLPGIAAAGSGGAGFGGAGGSGGVPPVGGVSGPGGPAYGDLSILLEGGSGGASGTVMLHAGGGGGGGALFVSALAGIVISGSGLISADGGDGAVSGQGGSGGGSGGGVVLFAPAVTNDGAVSADGGHGGAGGCCGAGGGGGGGRILVAGASAGVGSYSAAGGITGLGGGPFGRGALGTDGGAGVVTIDPTVFPPLVIEVAIDIKPGSDPNTINTKSKGLVPVAIMSTLNFDATTVDPDSVTFGPGATTPVNAAAHLEDVDGDSDLDLVLHFKTQDAGLALGDSEACLDGTTFGGATIHGCDAVRIKK